MLRICAGLPPARRERRVLKKGPFISRGARYERVRGIAAVALVSLLLVGWRDALHHA